MSVHDEKHRQTCEYCGLDVPYGGYAGCPDKCPRKDEWPIPVTVEPKLEDLTFCPTCGKSNWKWIPDSLAQHCSCGFVRIEIDEYKNQWKRGASIQEWLNDTYAKDSPIPNPHKETQ